MIKKLYKALVPKSIQNKISSKISDDYVRKSQEHLLNAIIAYFEKYPNEVVKEGFEEPIQHLKANGLSVFPYQFSDKYSKDDIEVHYDQGKDLRYVMLDDKRLYFKRSLGEKGIRSLFYGLQLDQDIASPHRYLTKQFNLKEGEVIADIGAAEGNFSLSNIEKIKKVYLFEQDPDWIEALEATFENWKDKVEIVNKFVSNKIDDKCTTIDHFFKDKEITFFKADIEGEEARFLEGANTIIDTNNQLRGIVCTYHKEHDFEEFSALFQKKNYKVTTTDKHMLYHYDKAIKAPYFRKALIRVEKQS